MVRASEKETEKELRLLESWKDLAKASLKDLERVAE